MGVKNRIDISSATDLQVASIKRWLYLVPLGSFYLPFLVLPATALFFVSLFRGSNLYNLRFVGFDNYVFLYNDGVVLIALRNTLVYALFNTIFTVGGGLLLALCILGTYKRARIFIRFGLLLPFAIMPVGIGIVWSFMYHTRTGVINTVLERLFGITRIVEFLGDPFLALPAVITVGVWQFLGFYTILWLVGLLNVDERYYELAKLDGANKIQTFRYVTLPLVKPIGVFLLIVSAVGALKVFAYVWVLTRGGPGHSTEVMVTWMFKVAFRFSNMGEGAAIGVILFVVSLSIVLTITKVIGLGDSQ